MTYQQREVVFEGEGRVSIRSGDPLPAPSAYDLIVRARLSIVSAGTETAFLDTKYPTQPGPGIVGEIVQVGDAVTAMRPELTPGSRVFVRQSHRAYVRCNSLRDCVYVLPVDLSDEAVLLARQAIVGIHAVKQAGLRLGVSAHIIGLGIVGQLITRLAVIAGARPVTAADHHKNRRFAAESQRVVQIRQSGELRPQEADAVLLACGSASALAEGLEIVASGGALVLVGAGMGAMSLDIHDRVFRRNIRMIGAHEIGAMQGAGNPAEWESLLDLPVRLIREGSLEIAGLITHYVAPGELAQAYRMLRAGKSECIGAVIDWNIA
ncbi:zinc-binding dehydrogenase [Streptomyces sp. NPDC090045]|uniref:zinc-binding dehydrogenase n=1 Tax=Streptomyces sp. NPDC090045 TaxID=3365927 RepID=UPI0037F43CD6